MLEVLVATAIAAVTELLKRVHDKDYRGVMIILVAALVGAGATFLPEVEYTLLEGLIAGLGIAGVHQIARQVG